MFFILFMRVSFNLLNSYNHNVSFSQKNKETVAILGSSREVDAILEYMDMSSRVTADLTKAGFNILHGCGTLGIMGSVYDAVKDNSFKNKEGKPQQSLAIIREPLWGDEDLDNCITIASVKSEAERVEQFSEMADSFIIFPGSAATLQEATTLIAKSHYTKPELRKKIILVGNEFFKGISAQYDILYQTGLLSCKPEELFVILEEDDEILKTIKTEKRRNESTTNKFT